MNQYQLIYDKVSEVISDAKDMEPEALTLDISLPELELDSLDYVELMILAKREFNVTLDAEMFIQYPSMRLGDLCQHIHQEMAA